MLNKLFDSLQKSQSLIGQAKKQTYTMLAAADRLVTYAYDQLADSAPLTSDYKERVKDMDIQINKLHREVRKLLAEHLILCQGDDTLLALELSIIVDNLERIGDFGKNLADLAIMMEDRPAFSKYLSQIQELSMKTKKNFAHIIALGNDSFEEDARIVINTFGDLARFCNTRISEIFKSNKTNFSREDLGLVLFLRYTKRINGHLTTIATSYVNPFHQIGYRKNTV